MKMRLLQPYSKPYSNLSGFDIYALIRGLAGGKDAGFFIKEY